MKLFLLILLIFVGCSGKDIELDYKIKILKCMHYCSTNYSFENCKEICLKTTEEAKNERP